MIKILVVSHSSVVGSYQDKLHRLAQYPDVEIMLVVPPRWNEGGRMVEAETHRYPTIKVCTIPVFFTGIASLHFYHPFLLSRMIKSFDPDLIFAEEEPWSFTALQMLRIAGKHKKKFIFYTWENICRSYNLISYCVLRYVLRFADGAVAGNDEAKEILIKRGFGRPVIILPQYGVDTELFLSPQTSSSTQLPFPRPLVGYVGRLVKEKNVDLLLSAVAAVRDEMTLVIIGNGPEKDHLVSMAQRLSLKERVKFIDAVRYNEIPSYVNALDIVVLPSMTTRKWKEQFGRILVEAMACGVAVIGSDSGAIPGVIGDAGLIFKEGDVESLRQQLQRLVSNEQERKSFGKSGRSRVESLFTNSVIAEQIFDFVKNRIGITASSRN